MSDRRESWSRRQFVGGVTLAGTVGVFGARPERVAAEPPPETTRLRIVDNRTGGRFRATCIAPQYVAEELLRGEGFTDVHYLIKDTFDERLRALATGEADITITFISSLIARLDVGDPIVLLAGAHVGCFELFGNERVRTIGDLKGKTVAVSGLGNADHLFLSVILRHVGLDPHRDVRWVTYPAPEAIRRFAEGKLDALLGFPPVPQEFRALKIGRLILNSSADRPWSHYFCCVVAAHRDFVSRYPVATKRALRGMVKAVDLCALEPERVARLLVDKRYAERSEYTLQALRDVPYAKWRDYDPEDAVRFYALRLHEAGLIQSTPQKIIAKGTDWRVLKELKKELKG
jgi:NitT/TauT family transport system substrate-binding protein